MRYTTREALRVRRWWLARQIEVQEALIGYHHRRELAQVEEHGKPKGSTTRKLYHAERRLDALTEECIAIDLLFGGEPATA